MTAASGSAFSAVYKYDPMDRRMSVSGTGTGVTAKSWVHADDMEIAEYSGAGVLLRRLVLGTAIDQRVAMVEADGTTFFYHPDRLGHIIALSNGTTGSPSHGDLTDKYVYTPFGIQLPLSTSPNPFRYTGRRFDPETGLYHYRARFYDASLGRFLQPDPIGYEDQMNLYAYVRNDPLNATDPMGERESNILCGRIGILCGGGTVDEDDDENDDRDLGGANLFAAIFNPAPNPSQTRYSENQVEFIAEEGTKKLKESVQACVSSEFGSGTAVSAGLAASGANIIPTASKAKGATPGTSAASVVSRAIFGDLKTKDIGLPRRVWAPTSKNLGSMTSKVGGVVGRWTPILGATSLAADVAEFNDCLADEGS